MASYKDQHRPAEGREASDPVLSSAVPYPAAGVWLLSQALGPSDNLPPAGAGGRVWATSPSPPPLPGGEWEVKRLEAPAPPPPGGPRQEPLEGSRARGSPLSLRCSLSWMENFSYIYISFLIFFKISSGILKFNMKLNRKGSWAGKQAHRKKSVMEISSSKGE